MPRAGWAAVAATVLFFACAVAVAIWGALPWM